MTHQELRSVSDGAFDYGTKDGYEFYLKAGPIKNLAAMMELAGPMEKDGQGVGHSKVPFPFHTHPAVNASSCQV